MNETRFGNVRVLIPFGFGLNCEDETEHDGGDGRGRDPAVGLEGGDLIGRGLPIH